MVFNLSESIPVDLDSFYNFHKKHLSKATAAIKDTTNMSGIYIFEPEIFDLIPEGFSMLETDVFPELAKENRLVFFPVLNRV
jgi:NDP-sugar pyrophosphorylase family protein